MCRDQRNQRSHLFFSVRHCLNVCENERSIPRNLSHSKLQFLSAGPSSTHRSLLQLHCQRAAGGSQLVSLVAELPQAQGGKAGGNLTSAEAPNWIMGKIIKTSAFTPHQKALCQSQVSEAVPPSVAPSLCSRAFSLEALVGLPQWLCLTQI